MTRARYASRSNTPFPAAASAHLPSTSTAARPKRPLLAPVFAVFVRTRSVQLTLLPFCNAFRALAVCCCVSAKCAAARDDLLPQVLLQPRRCEHLTPHPVPSRQQPQTQQLGPHNGCNMDPRSAHTTETEAREQPLTPNPPGARNQAQTPQRRDETYRTKESKTVQTQNTITDSLIHIHPNRVCRGRAVEAGALLANNRCSYAWLGPVRHPNLMRSPLHLVKSTSL